MLLTVEVPGWELDESGRVLSVGDHQQFWLTFKEVAPGPSVAEAVNLIRGVAVPLPTWPGGEFGRHAVRIDVEGGALYWDAPEETTGPVDVAGTISTSDIDVPEDFPETSGILRRIRMVWTELVLSPEGAWLTTGKAPRYEEVASTYLPVREPTALDPQAEADLRRRARETYDSEVAAGRLHSGESFRVGLKVSASSRKFPAGTTQTRWTGVLVDLDTEVPEGT